MGRTGMKRIDPDVEAGARAIERLEREQIGWLATVAADGTPQTSPIWFIWDGDTFLLYSRNSPRVRNLTNSPRVSLNLDGDGLGGDIIVVEGIAHVDEGAPTAAENPAYLAKYKRSMDAEDWTPEWFTGRYSVPIRITPTKFRYW